MRRKQEKQIGILKTINNAKIKWNGIYKNKCRNKEEYEDDIIKRIKVQRVKWFFYWDQVKITYIITNCKSTGNKEEADRDQVGRIKLRETW